MIKLKESGLMFLIQIVSYSLLCINFRAVAQAEYFQAAISDFTIATLGYFVIKKLANTDNSLHQWLGYSLGGVVGSIIGIYLSKILLGG